MTAQPPPESYGVNPPGHGPGDTSPTDLRSRAAIALVLGLVGAFGTGALSTGVTSVMWAFDDGWFTSPTGQWVVVGTITAAFGAAALFLAQDPARSRDQVAVPVARAAQVAAVIGVVAGLLTVLGGLLDSL